MRARAPKAIYFPDEKLRLSTKEFFFLISILLLPHSGEGRQVAAHPGAIATRRKASSYEPDAITGDCKIERFREESILFVTLGLKKMELRYVCY